MRRSGAGRARGGRARRRARLAGALAAVLALLGWRLLRVLPQPGDLLGEGAREAPAVRIGCRLARPVDGDSFEARCGAQRLRVRLLRIDTPEFGEPGSAAARRALGALLREGPFRLEAEGEAFERDRYGRLLAYAWSARGTLINEAMIRLGWSRFDTRFGAGRFADRLRRAEEEARRARRGLHAPDRGWDRGTGASRAPRRLAFA